jgi:hypothetical protein
LSSSIDIGPVARLLLAAHPQGQGDILIGGHVIKQPEILEDDADPAAQQRQFVARDHGDVAVEHANQSACRFERHEQQAHQRGLARTRRSGQELKRFLRDVKAEIAQDLGSHAIAQPDIFEMDQRLFPVFQANPQSHRVWLMRG